MIGDKSFTTLKPLHKKVGNAKISLTPAAKPDRTIYGPGSKRPEPPDLSKSSESGKNGVKP